jgi:hypothetical protein
VKRTGYVFLILICAVVGIILYYVFNPVKALALVLPSFDEISYVHFDIKNDSAHVKVFVIVKNNQPYKLQIDTFFFKIGLAGTELLQEKVPVHLGLSKYKSDTLQVPLHFSISKVKRILANIRDQDSTELKTDIYLVYNTFVGQKRFDYSNKKTIQVPIPPEVKVLKVQQTDYHLGRSTAKANIKVQIINQGKYVDLKLNDIRYSLRIKNTLSSNGMLKEPVNIKPGTSMIVNIPAIINLDHPLKTAWLVALDKDNSKYTLNLRSNVKVNNFKEINIIPMEVNAVGVMELKK